VSFSIDYLLSRGYAVVAPMMRGFADSGGKAAIAGCDLARFGQLNAQDILAVISAMRSRPEIDGSRVLIMGQSFGGWNALALATVAPPGGVRTSACNHGDAALFDGMAQFGRKLGFLPFGSMARATRLSPSGSGVRSTNISQRLGARLATWMSAP
jgi:dipeptidyl aminopeptidase/acylaminoacyl peptidase